ncbi:unnamed protein product [Mytilus coruscus]|uniref:OTU domain-containing protein n=1 Tax=Mytilus coruscus TaxID=42192 RepID=A0A6J8E1C5_MYTCO|nr:unnamed protein product [Mytilus coruscus]
MKKVKTPIYEVGQQVLVRYRTRNNNRVPNKAWALLGTVIKAEKRNHKYQVSFVPPYSKCNKKQWFYVSDITGSSLSGGKNSSNPEQRQKKHSNYKSPYYMILTPKDKTYNLISDFRLTVAFNPPGDGNCQFAAISHQLPDGSNIITRHLPIITIGHYPEGHGEHYLSLTYNHNAVRRIAEDSSQIHWGYDDTDDEHDDRSNGHDDTGSGHDDTDDKHHDTDDGHKDTDDTDTDDKYDDTDDEHNITWYENYDICDEHIITVDEHDITGNEHNITGDVHDITGDEHNITGDEHDITGDEHDITGDEHDITGDEHNITGDEHDITGDEHDITGDEHNITGDEHDMTDDEHDITGYEHDITGDEHNITCDEHDIIGDVHHDTGVIYNENQDTESPISLRHQVEVMRKKSIVYSIVTTLNVERLYPEKFNL